MRVFTLLGLSIVLLAGCASPTLWAPGQGVAASDFEPTKARCSMMARHGGGGFAAYGSQSYVAGAALGNAIGESMRAQADFSDCMKASGWLPVSQEAVAARNTKAASYKPISDQRKACVAELRADPQFVLLIPHLPTLETATYSMAQTADERLPSVPEATALSAYWDGITACSTTSRAAYARIEPRLDPILSDALAENAAVVVLLVQRKISWGAWAQRATANSAAVKERIRTANL
jgi:hypothetical protein